VPQLYCWSDLRVARRPVLTGWWGRQFGRQ
jgi:hypothetical protein